LVEVADAKQIDIEFQLYILAAMPSKSDKQKTRKLLMRGRKPPLGMQKSVMWRAPWAAKSALHMAFAGKVTGTEL
jgi:hypothetical protein